MTGAVHEGFVLGQPWSDVVGPVLRFAVAVGDKVVVRQKANGQRTLCTYSSREAAEDGLRAVSASPNLGGARIVKRERPVKA